MDNQITKKLWIIESFRIFIYQIIITFKDLNIKKNGLILEYELKTRLGAIPN